MASSDQNPIPVGYFKLTPASDLTTSTRNLSSGKENNIPELPERVSPERKSIVREKPSSCVFVASLNALRTDDELYKSVHTYFAKFGNMTSVKVLRDPLNRPYAFVQYTKDEDSQLAILMGHNAELDGRQLRCEPAKVNRTLFLTVSEPSTSEQVQEIVSTYGETDLIVGSTRYGKVLRNKPLDDRKANWFVKFTYREDAIRAFASLSDDYEVQWAQNIDDLPKPDKVSRKAVFVGLLPAEVTRETIRDHFSSHGAIKSIELVLRTAHPFAFIEYEEETSAARAVERANHSRFMNKSISVRYRESYPKSNPKHLLSPVIPVALAPPPVTSWKKPDKSRIQEAHRLQHYNRAQPLRESNSIRNERNTYRVLQRDYNRNYQAPSQENNKGSQNYEKKPLASRRRQRAILGYERVESDGVSYYYPQSRQG